MDAEAEGVLNEGYTFEDRIESRDAGKTAQAFLSSRYPNRDWAALIAQGKVSIAGRPVQADTLLARKDVVRFFRDPWIEPVVDRAFSVAFEDDELLVVVKRKGMPIVPHGNFLQNSLLHIVRAAGHPEAAPLHRLGRGTTGAIAFAKHNAGAKKWCRAFAERSVRKVYRCVVSGVPEWDVLESQCYIGGVAHPGCAGGVFAAVPEASPGAKVAITHFRVVERGPTWAVLDAHILTGRAHQIRIMTGYVGFPLLGDPLYGVGGVPRTDGAVFDEDGHDRPAAPGDVGYLLHSMCLEIGHVRVLVPPPNLEEWAPYHDWSQVWCLRLFCLD